MASSIRSPPTGQGFDESFGFNNGHWNHYFDAELLRGAKPESTTGYIADVLTDEAIRFIDQRKDKPFFCYLSYNTPHSPYQVSDALFQKFKAKGLPDSVAAFYGMCENIDTNVGRLLGHLEQRGLSDDTVVIFLTDNGGTAGVKLYNAGMRGGKTSVHEGGSRVPLFILWPKAGWTPRVVDTITSHIDILPTLLDLCATAPLAGPKMDGLSLRPLLEKPDAAWPERTLFTHNPISETNKFPGAVRTQRYRLVREIAGKSGGSSAVANDASAKPWQLYDMEADPGQANDIAAKLPEVVTDLEKRYDAWFADISSGGLQRFPIPVGHAQHNPVELHAPQAFVSKPLHFASGPGFANDWLTGWTDPAATVRFEIDVVTAGEYELELAYGCPAADAGAKLEVRAADQTLTSAITAAEAPEIPLPHRDEDGHQRYRNRQWGVLKMGQLALPKGPTTLTLRALDMPGSQVMELKHVKLRAL